MANVLDITDKLKFEESPKLLVKGKEIRVKDDAPTMLRVMALIGADPKPADIAAAYEEIFDEQARKVIEELRINFRGLVVLIQSAIELVVGTPS